MCQNSVSSSKFVEILVVEGGNWSKFRFLRSKFVEILVSRTKIVNFFYHYQMISYYYRIIKLENDY